MNIRHQRQLATRIAWGYWQRDEDDPKQRCPYDPRSAERGERAERDKEKEAEQAARAMEGARDR